MLARALEALPQPAESLRGQVLHARAAVDPQALADRGVTVACRSVTPAAEDRADRVDDLLDRVAAEDALG